MAIPIPDAAGPRERVVIFLAFLTSEDCQNACRQYARPEELAAALSRLWFNDIYAPGQSYLDGLKGDRSIEDLERFEACFSDSERAILERFHGFFELRLDFVTNRVLGRAFFPDNDSWRGLIKHAAYVLAELEPDPDRLRTLLAAYVTQALEPASALREAVHAPRLLLSGKA